MCMKYSYEAACRKAAQLGALIESGREWTRAKGFPSAEVAWYFQTQFNGMESVGAFPDENGQGFSVDFR